MNFQLPQQDDDFDCYGNSSQDESRGSRGRHFVSSMVSMYFFLPVFILLVCFITDQFGLFVFTMSPFRYSSMAIWFVVVSVDLTI